MATTTKKRVDALTIKRQGAAALAARLAGMTLEQQRQFWEERTRALRARQANAQRGDRHGNTQWSDQGTNP